MVPTASETLINIEEKEQPSNTFAMKEKNIKGRKDGIEALKQAIYLILSVERYTCPIVSSNYGAELSDLIGTPLSYAIPECEYRIKDALIQDDRIEDVTDFKFERTGRNSLLVKFTVESNIGTFEAEKEVSV